MFARLPSLCLAIKQVFCNTNYNVSPPIRSFKKSIPLQAKTHGNNLACLYKKSLDNSKADSFSSFVVEHFGTKPSSLSYGAPEASSGALFSGQFSINILSILIVFNTLKVKLFQIITTQNLTAYIYYKEF
jgi:hypothetical protein